MTIVILAGLVAIFFVASFRKMYRAEQGLLIPQRVWRIGCGVRLTCQTLRLPQPTSMGGTLPGPPSRWLMIEKPGGKQSRLLQVYHELDLLKINCALSGQKTTQVNPSH